MLTYSLLYSKHTVDVSGWRSSIAYSFAYYAFEDELSGNECAFPNVAVDGPATVLQLIHLAKDRSMAKWLAPMPWNPWRPGFEAHLGLLRFATQRFTQDNLEIWGKPWGAPFPCQNNSAF